MQVRVYYEDTDAAGIVYYANYLRFAERARTELLREAGLDHPTLLARWDGVFAVRRCVVDYRAPAKLDDVLDVRTAVQHIGGASIEMEQQVSRAGSLLVTMLVTLAFLDRSLRPKRIPPEIRGIFEARRASPDE